jgi:hypothetical protein
VRAAQAVLAQERPKTLDIFIADNNQRLSEASARSTVWNKNSTRFT